MDLERTCITQINPYIKVTSKMGFKMVKQRKFGLMVQYTKGVLWEVRSKDLGFLNGLTNQSTKGILMRTILTEKVNTHGLINVIIEENGETI